MTGSLRPTWVERCCSWSGALTFYVAFCAIMLTGCKQRADEADCDGAYTHMVSLKTKGEPAIVRKLRSEELEPQRLAFLEACVNITSKRVIECWKRSKDQTEMKACRDER